MTDDHRLENRNIARFHWDTNRCYEILYAEVEKYMYK